MSQLIDSEGYRSNVGIIVCDPKGRVFWCKRIGQDAWQFPQGGVRREESAVEAMYRELREETGLLPKDVEMIGCTRGWLRYRLPGNLVRRHVRPCCIGQKQKWFLLRLVGGEDRVDLHYSRKPEFDSWRWAEYWDPVREVVFFKRNVYERALKELAPLLFRHGPPAPRARSHVER